MGHVITWIDGGRPPRVAPDQRYPDGVDLVGTSTEPMCKVALPYPTGHKNIGQWSIRCDVCGMTAVVTAASRPDDPKSITLPCIVQ